MGTTGATTPRHRLYLPYTVGLDSPITYLFERIAPHFDAETFEATVFSADRSRVIDADHVREVYAPSGLRRRLALLATSLRSHDLLHTGGLGHYRISQLAHLRNPGLRHVHTFRVDVNSSTFPTERKRELLELVDAVTAVSEHTAATVEAEYGVSPTVIYNGVDTELFRPDHDRPQLLAAHGAEEPVFVFVGNFVDRKRPADVLEVARRIEDATFLFFGDGPLFDELRPAADALGNVRFLGRVPKSTLPAVYANARGLVFPSIREGCPNVVLEAMASGTPVVGYDATSMPELVTTGRTGFLAEPGDVAGLVEGVRSLLDPERAADLGRAARDYAESNHRFDQRASAYEAVYQTVLE